MPPAVQSQPNLTTLHPPLAPKAEAAARVLRRLGLAIKTSALYPPSHPGRITATAVLLGDLHAYTEAYGALSLQIGRQTLSVDGLPVDGSSNLANFLYTRKVSQVTILPAADQPQIAAFVSIAGMERSQLDAAGGLEQLLQEAGAWDIKVTELVLRVRDDAEILDLGAFFSLLGQGRLSPQERDRVVDILRAGSDQVAKLLQNVYSLAGEVLEDIGEDGPSRQVKEAIRNLDRIILDEPFDRQQALYEHLAAATLLLGPPIDRQVIPALLAAAQHDAGIQVVLHHLTGEQLAEMILAATAKGGSADEIVRTLRGLSLKREKAQGVLSALDARLPGPREPRSSLTEVVLPQLHFSDETDGAVPAEFSESELAVSPEELAAYRREAQRIDEAGAAGEGLITLLDVLRNEPEQKELLDAADGVAGCLRGLVEHGEFGLLRGSLEILQAIPPAAPGPRGEIIDALLEGIAGGPFPDQALAVLSEGKETAVADDVHACMTILGKHTIGPLVRMLQAEQRVEMRELLCNLLVRLAREHVDVLGAFVSDDRGPLVRQVAHILGRIGRPEGTSHLVRLVRHPDFGVRVEALNALASIGTDAAQAQICLFLHDPEPMIRVRALSSLDTHGMRLALPALAPVLEAPDRLNRRFVVRRAAINAIARVRAAEALPSLKKLAAAPFAVGRCRRELRRLAREAVVTIEQSGNARTPHSSGPSL